MEELSDYFYK